MTSRASIDAVVPVNKHGTASAYTYYRCRCGECVENWRLYQRMRRAKKPSVRQTLISDAIAHGNPVPPKAGPLPVKPHSVSRGKIGRPNLISLDVNHKTCSRCHKEKAINQFHRNATAPLGHHSQCRSCRHAYMKRRDHLIRMKNRAKANQVNYGTRKDSDSDDELRRLIAEQARDERYKHHIPQGLSIDINEFFAASIRDPRKYTP